MKKKILYLLSLLTIFVLWNAKTVHAQGAVVAAAADAKASCTDSGECNDPPECAGDGTGTGYAISAAQDTAVTMAKEDAARDCGSNARIRAAKKSDCKNCDDVNSNFWRIDDCVLRSEIFNKDPNPAVQCSSYKYGTDPKNWNAVCQKMGMSAANCNDWHDSLPWAAECAEQCKGKLKRDCWLESEAKACAEKVAAVLTTGKAAAISADCLKFITQGNINVNFSGYDPSKVTGYEIDGKIYIKPKMQSTSTYGSYSYGGY